MYREDKNSPYWKTIKDDGVKMGTVLKWIATGLLAGLMWLVAGYADEYFRPYKKVRSTVRNK
jgi:hypothetical protein